MFNTVIFIPERMKTLENIVIDFIYLSVEILLKNWILLAISLQVFSLFTIKLNGFQEVQKYILLLAQEKHRVFL